MLLIPFATYQLATVAIAASALVQVVYAPAKPQQEPTPVVQPAEPSKTIQQLNDKYKDEK